MTLGLLFLIVIAVYLLQCICWATPGSVVFTLGLRRRGKRHHGFVWNALNTTGLLANPLPPLTPLLVVQWPAFELTPDGIHFPSKEGEPVSLPWDKLTITHSDTRLRCNGSLVFKGSEIQVEQYAALLQQLRRAGRGQRSQIIHDCLRKSMSTQTAARRVLVLSRRSRWLRILSNLQFVFLFLLVPLGFERFGTMILWRVILMLVVVNAAVTLEFWMVHRELFPRAGDHRLKSGITSLLSPLGAIRAGDAVARELLSGFHPLAAAAAVLSEEEFRRFAGEQLRLCRFGDYHDQRYQQTLHQLMEQAVRKEGVNPEELLRPPVPDPGCVVYCPRCLAQYTKQRSECTDCGYDGLRSFDRVAPPPSAVIKSN